MSTIPFTLNQSDWVDWIQNSFLLPTWIVDILNPIFMSWKKLDLDVWDYSKQIEDVNWVDRLRLTINTPWPFLPNIEWIWLTSNTVLSSNNNFLISEELTFNVWSNIWFSSKVPEKILFVIKDWWIRIQWQNYVRQNLSKEFIFDSEIKQSAFVIYETSWSISELSSKFQNNSTLSSIVIKTRSILKSQWHWWDLYDDELIISTANHYMHEINSWEVVNILDLNKTHIWYNLEYLRQTYNERLILWMKLTKDFKFWDQILYCTVDKDISNSWMLEINWQIIKYWEIAKVDWKSIWFTSLVLEDNVIANFWDTVNKAYELKETFKKWWKELKIALELEDWSSRIIHWKDERQENISYNIRTVLYRRHNCFVLHWFWRFLLEYKKSILSITFDMWNIDMTSEVNCMLPDDYWLKILPYLIAWDLMQDNMEERAVQTLIKWYSKLENFYRIYSKPSNTFERITNPNRHNSKIKNFTI